MAKKAIKSKPLPAAGALPRESAMIGGVSNRTANPSAKKTGPAMSFAKGGKVISSSSC